MFFADTKTGHLLHILGTALAGQVLTQELAPANPHAIELYGHLVIQVTGLRISEKHSFVDSGKLMMYLYEITNQFGV